MPLGKPPKVVSIEFFERMFYNKYEDHIQKIEKELMKKHRLGYSALVKFLILKEGKQQFGIPFV